MDKNRVAGKAKQVKGAVQDAAGGLTGNTGQQIRGKLNKVAGRVQEGVGKAKDEVRAEEKNAEERSRKAP